MKPLQGPHISSQAYIHLLGGNTVCQHLLCVRYCLLCKLRASSIARRGFTALAQTPSRCCCYLVPQLAPKALSRTLGFTPSLTLDGSSPSYLTDGSAHDAILSS